MAISVLSTVSALPSYTVVPGEAAKRMPAYLARAAAAGRAGRAGSGAAACAVANEKAGCQ